MKIYDTNILSTRNTKIPCTVILSEQAKSPLLIFMHGFKANRSEDGRFLTVGKALGESGISSIMMGFAGCDDSKEDFENYSVSSCLSDIDQTYDYMKQFDIDTNRLGLIGYSMGGRLASIYSTLHPECKVLGLWAGACFKDYGSSDDFLGSNLKEMLNVIKKQPYYLFHNLFDDTYLRLSRTFFSDMVSFDPEKALRKFSGSAIVVQGDEDITVDPAISFASFSNLSSCRNKKLHIVKGADHGFGAWNGRMDLSDELTSVTIQFFRENL